MCKDQVLLSPAKRPWHKLEDEVIVLSGASGLFLGLKGVAENIWMILQAGSCTRDDILTSFCKDFQQNPIEIEKLLDDALKEMLERGLIVLGSSDIL